MSANTSKRSAALIVLLTFGIAACGESPDDEVVVPSGASAGGKADIYGEDDRAETYAAVKGSQSRRLARASAMLSDRSAFVENLDADGEIVGYRLAEGSATLGQDWGLCEGERFTEQPSVGFCSATLVAPDLVATSGHCLGAPGATPEQARCSDVRVVFDFGYTSEDDHPFDVFNNMSPDSVYDCERIEAIGWNPELINEDWALIRLDRPVVDREPIAVLSTPPKTNTPVLQIGHPTGIPQKLAPGKVTNRTDFPASDVFAGNTFTYDSDLFGGNSGGGVFDLENDALAGIPTLYSGQDYIWDSVRSCRVPGVCGENTTCTYPPGGYGTFKMLEKLQEVASPLIDELTLVEGEVDPEPEPNPGADANLMISEYLEGSGWNKAVEIYNPSAEPVDATRCSIELYYNGSTEVSARHEIEGTLEPGSTYTVCEGRSDADVINHEICDAMVGLGFNGNDAVVLECGGVQLDAIGRIGDDPGKGWSGESGGTVDDTLRRDCAYQTGILEFSLLEWISAGIDDASDLGRHDCG